MYVGSRFFEKRKVLYKGYYRNVSNALHMMATFITLFDIDINTFKYEEFFFSIGRFLLYLYENELELLSLLKFTLK